MDGMTPQERWEEELSAALGVPVRVCFGRARRDVLVARPQGEGLRVRMNAGFADAPPEVRQATAGWLRSGRRARRASARLDAFVAELAERLPPPPTRRAVPRPAGAHHDLRALLPAALGELPAGLLPDGDVPPVTWGRRGRSPARRGLRLGSFDPEVPLVRVHSVLDQPGVPAWFVCVVLHHELLHAALPSRSDARGRIRHHPPEFRRLERAHPDHARALAWEDEHLAALLRSARTGRPMPASRPRTGWLFPGLGG